jgi:hypothetical protein
MMKGLIVCWRCSGINASDAKECWCYGLKMPAEQAGPVMVRHTIGGEVLLPADAKIYARWKDGDEILSDLGGCF